MTYSYWFFFSVLFVRHWRTTLLHVHGGRELTYVFFNFVFCLFYFYFMFLFFFYFSILFYSSSFFLVFLFVIFWFFSKVFLLTLFFFFLVSFHFVSFFEMKSNCFTINIYFMINGPLKMLPRHFLYFYCFSFKMTFDKKFMKKSCHFLKSDSHLPKNFLFIYSNEKNAFISS